MNLNTSHHFVARGDLSQGKISIPAMVIGSYSEYDSDPVQCKVVPDSGNFSGLSNLWDHSKIIEFSGTLENGHDVWISNFRVNRTGSIHSVRDIAYFEGSAELYIEARQGSLEKFNDPGQEIICYAVIPPTPLVLSRVGDAHEYNYDGTIKLSDENARKGISWDSPLGRVELIDNYSHTLILCKIPRVVFGECKIAGSVKRECKIRRFLIPKSGQTGQKFGGLGRGL